MRLVILESPYAGDVEANMHYAKGAVHDCLTREEAPIASHLLFTQPGILRDGVPEERKMGIEAGWAWYRVPFVSGVFYLDRGMSSGMEGALAVAERGAVTVEFRFLEPLARVKGEQPIFGDPARRPYWGAAPFNAPATGAIAEGHTGRLEAALCRRARTRAAPYSAAVGGRVAAFYRTMEDAQAGAELWDAFLAAHPELRARAARLTGP